jgi:hypothetical protein
VAATWPAIRSFDSAFMANARLSAGEPPAGDHLQSVYRFWLVGHQLQHGRAPWKDPYSFQPIVDPQTVLGGWPFGFLFWPLNALFGPVVAWNLMLLGTVIAAGLLTYAWLRTLALPMLPAAAGGLAFALAPYRLEQSAGHLLGWVALFIPLALLSIERARVAETRRAANLWGAFVAVAVVSIVLAGQLHLALGVIPFVLAYAALRFERASFTWTAAGALVAAGLGLAVRYTLIADSREEQGRSVGEVRHYSAEWTDFLNRWHAPRSEEFVYFGWLVPALALVGLVYLGRSRRGLAVLLGAAVLVPVLLALGTNLPGYASAWRRFPPLHFTRVPERLLPIAVLALAALLAFAVAEVAAGRALVVVVAIVLVALDLIVQPLSAAAADPDNKGYQALASSPPGRVLQLPLFEPGVHYGSVYDYYQLQSARQQPGGYDTLAPKKAFDFYFRHDRLSCGVWLPGDAAELRSLGITRIVFHRGMYTQAGRRGAPFAENALWDAAWHPSGSGGRVTVWAPGDGSHPPSVSALPRPSRSPIFCSGWLRRTMVGTQATIWIYGGGTLRLSFSGGRPARLYVDARPARGNALSDTAWHSVLIVAPKPGLHLETLSLEP